MNSIISKASLLKSVRHFRRLSTNAKEGAWDYDVIVNGGGAVGASFVADLLMKTNGSCKIAVIENLPLKPLRTTKTIPDARVYALSHRSVKFLDSIGAWKHVSTRSQSYNAMQIWESNGPGLVKFNARDLGVDDLGLVAEDSTIQSAIYQSIQDNGYKFDLIQGETIGNIVSPSDKSFTLDPITIDLVDPKNPQNPPRKLTSRLLVGADGGNSVVRRLTGVPTYGWNYAVEGVVATISTREILPNYQPTSEEGTNAEPISPFASLNNTTAWQRYLPTGPLGVLPLWDGFASIVWSVPSPEARRLKSLTNEQFVEELNNVLSAPPQTDRWSAHNVNSDSTNFPPFLNILHNCTNIPKDKFPSGIFSTVKKEVAAVLDTVMSAAQISDPYFSPPKIHHVCGPRFSFPLAFQQAKYYTTPRSALIGDAAHSIHPQAGQGLNLGLADAAQLSEVISTAIVTGSDFGSHLILEKYARDRYTKNLLMLSTVDAINTVFKDQDIIFGGMKIDDKFPLMKGKQLLRSIGMLGVNNLKMVKNEMAKFAMGIN